MKLFAVYLGGKAKNANLEVHDLVFVVGKNIKECFPKIKSQWFGSPQSVHIDSYAELSQIKGFKIELTTEKKTSKYNLFFINLGFASNVFFGEEHLMGFITSTSKEEAKQQAKSLLPKGKIGGHIDNLIKLPKVESYYVNVVPNDSCKDFKFTNVYWKL